jgi:uncharacterized membrane protein (UPF0136 family)
MNIADFAYLLYPLILLYAGWLGYSARGSIASLVAGIVVAIALESLGILSRKAVHFSIAGAAVIFVMTVYFAYRLIISNRFIPSGIFMIISFFFLFAALLGIFLKLMRNPDIGPTP